MAQMKIMGARELEKVLKQLPDRLARNVTFNGLRAGGRVIASAAKANLRSNGSVDTGALAEAIKVETRKRSRKGSAVVAVGIENKASQRSRKGADKSMKVNPSKYAHLVEFGTEPHVIQPKKRKRLAFQGNDGLVVTSAIQHPGTVAKPFMRPAVDQYGKTAASKITETMARGVEREARALASGSKSFVTGKRIK